MSDARLDLAEIRRRLRSQEGRALWRSLDELAESPAFAEFLETEFPRQAAGVQAARTGRREFLQLMSASLALAGLGACTRQPEEQIIPYVRQPERLVLGVPLYYATTMPLAGFGIGLVAESHEGRPTKVEGNAQHPASLGATDAMTQATVLGLYDPDRSQVIVSAGQIRPWSAFDEAMAAMRAAQAESGGAGLRILTETVTSPTLARQMDALLTAFPKARWHQYEPAARDNALAGARLAFGDAVDTQYRLDQAAIVVALDVDLFASGPARLRQTRDFARARRPDAPTMARLYVAESTPSLTGAKADHRLAVRSGDVEALARALAAGVGLPVPQREGGAASAKPWIDAVVADLRAHQGAAVVVAGDAQPPVVHALAHAMNHALGAVGKTVVHTAPVAVRPMDQLASLGELVTDMNAGAVDCLVVLGGNPAYTAPADLDFAAALQHVGLRVHLGLYEDETAALCQWHVPEAHYLESWGDVRAFDGTASLVQPLIAPLYGGRTAPELIAAVAGTPHSSHDLVRDTWNATHPDDFEAFWRQALHDGLIAGTAAPAVTPTLRTGWDSGPTTPATGDAEVLFRLDPYLFDGRFANNGWLQELPRPLTKLTWDNAALVAPATAERLGLSNEDVVELAVGKRVVRAPLWILPGQAADAVTLHLGYGRTRGGKVATGVGADAYRLRTTAALHAAAATLTPTGLRHPLACTQDHQSMEGRPLVRRGTLAEYRHDPHFAQHEGHAPARDMTLYPDDHPYTGHAWGMAIDLGACIGCNACVAACVAENNIAVVGKEQVRHGREMQWIRIDRYFAGDLDAPEILHQPVPCMHCENAPCEVVCPVNATVHSSEGLNDMVYNRCVGTRYCSNNCPYKVRRFNYFLYSDWTSETLKMARNPNVTVRSRGVMEKCTYCVQRIERVRIAAATDDRPIRDGEIVTACQQACPAEAIVFGDVNDPESRVAKLKADPRNYGLLADLNTRPRTTYLAGVTNPNPTLEDES